MKLLYSVLMLCVFAAGSIFAKPKEKNTEVMTALDSLSYSMGVLIGQSIKGAGVSEINAKEFSKAMLDVLKGNTPLISLENANKFVEQFLQKAAMAKKLEGAKKGKDFLEENKKKPGVVVLPSGLQYKILKDTVGEKPSEKDKVTVHYHGTLIDGTVFDSSVQRGEPIQFPVNGVIKGWVEALQLMSPGSKWILYIPSELGYGEQDMQSIPANSVLIFEVELLSLEKSINQ